MTAFEHQVADVILAIEAEMRRIGLWETQAPSPQALASLQPFCYDTLRFDQWLQWIFLVRMRALLEDGTSLPTTSDIAPLAEDFFATCHQDTDRLLALIRDFDRLIGS